MNTQNAEEMFVPSQPVVGVHPAGPHRGKT
jgi:hypothetical protein